MISILYFIFGLAFLFNNILTYLVSYVANFNLISYIQMLVKCVICDIMIRVILISFKFFQTSFSSVSTIPCSTITLTLEYHICREFPADEYRIKKYAHNGPLSQLVTLTSPYNPFNKLQNPEHV